MTLHEPWDCFVAPAPGHKEETNGKWWLPLRPCNLKVFCSAGYSLWTWALILLDLNGIRQYCCPTALPQPAPQLWHQQQCKTLCRQRSSLQRRKTNYKKVVKGLTGPPLSAYISWSTYGVIKLYKEHCNKASLLRFLYFLLSKCWKMWNI